jgi:predicted branched-subunit amino acid permease
MGVLIFWPAFTMAGVGDPNARSHLASIQSGVLGFVLPSLFLRLFVKEPAGLMPSVMCHFAVTLAVALAVLVSRERRLAVGEDKRIQPSTA